MVDIMCVSLLLINACVVTVFVFGLSVNRHSSSPHIFHSIAIACSLLLLFLPIIFHFYSPWSLIEEQLAAFATGSSFMFALKLLELAFAKEWTLTRNMTLKHVIISLITLPLTSESVADPSKERIQNVRRENILQILRGICQIAVMRALIYMIPHDWLSLPSSSFPPIVWPFRYALLFILLYLSFATISNIMFGITGFLFNIRMNSFFPALPFASTSLRDFWSRRWNAYVKASLHCMAFVIVPKSIGSRKTINKMASGLIAFALSGVMHEYELTLITNRWCGKNMIFFLLNGLLVLFEITVNIPMKPGSSIGKVIGWAWAMGTLLVLEPWIEAGHFANM
jgi:hypothetical protein